MTSNVLGYLNQAFLEAPKKGKIMTQAPKKGQ